MPGVLIPDLFLVAVCPFGNGLPAERAAEAIARGVRAAGMPEPDIFTIGDDRSAAAASGDRRGASLTTAPNEADLDARMRRARAVIVGAGRLRRDTLAGSPVFEIATRARQAGVPAYAVTARNDLDAFDARMMDLQVVIEAQGTRGLSAAGRRLAAMA